MILERKKKYKTDTPENTILNISTILNKKLNILLKETPTDAKEGLYSCRVNIANNNLLPFNIGTNGKGMKYEYALASAYGEFMERLQNLALLSGRNYALNSNWPKSDKSEFYQKLKERDLILKYKFAPDEETIIFEKKDDIIRKYIETYDIEEIERYYEGKALTLLPFYSVFENKEVKLPREVIGFACTSNGMCAGNSPLEAILQGLSEILERYVQKIIYRDNISFPNIPRDYFQYTEIFNIINLIEKKYNWEIDIKDCSCQIGLPVIGVLIQDKQKRMYKFHIGADPSPITALERTLTEIYQGRTNAGLLPIDIKLQTKLLTCKDLKDEEMFKTCTNGEGYHHINLLSKNSSYEFQGFDSNWGLSNENDMKLMVNLFSQIGSDIYIRDVSFLGFPSYFIYIPKISENMNIFNNSYFTEHVTKASRINKIARNIDVNNKSEIKDIANYKANSKVPLNKSFNTKNLWTYYDSDLILSLLYNSIGEKENSIQYIHRFLNKINGTSKEFQFFSCLRDTLIYDEPNRVEVLSMIYPEDLVNEVLMYLKENNFIKYLNHTTCFKCEECNIKESCFLIDYLRLCKSIENEYIKNTPSQINLSSLFNL